MSHHTIGVHRINSTELYPALHQAGDPGLPLLLVENRQARAVIALQGGQLLGFQPAGKDEILWLSPKALLAPGKPIRGGIPLCTPWFGPGPDGKSAHGFARLRDWTLAGAETGPDGSTHLALELNGDAATHPLWSHAFRFRLDVFIGGKLQLRFRAENRSAEPAPFAFAFHTYFAMQDVAQAHVVGLEGLTYVDKLDRGKHKPQQDELSINGPIDRVYLDVPAFQILRCAGRKVAIESASTCAVVWNPWTNDANMPDIGEGGHVGYLCVERGDVVDRAVTLAPGGEYQTWMTLADAV